MSKLPARIGFWASIAETLVTLVYIIGLVILIAAALSQHSPSDLAAQQQWTNMITYAQQYAENPVSLRIGLLVQASAFLAGILILVVFLAIHEMVDPNLKIVTRIASAFVLMMATLSSWGYYVQWASVHQAIMSGGDLEGLAQFAESNISSPGMATLQLSWALFYGIASLLILPAFGRTRIEKWIKAGFLFNGLIAVVVGIAYACGITSILPLAILGLIGASFVYPLLALRFHKYVKKAPE